MIENINKLLYLGVGLFLVVFALTSFYQHETAFQGYERSYNEVKENNRLWAMPLTNKSNNPLDIDIPLSKEALEQGLVYKGKDLKAQLLLNYKLETNAEILINGRLLSENELILWIQAIDNNGYYQYSFDSELLIYEVIKI